MQASASSGNKRRAEAPTTTTSSPRRFNPGSITDNDEDIPAKLWELLRRNAAFQEAFARLLAYDQKSRKSKHYPNSEWQKRAEVLLRRCAQNNSFAAIALQWLVPEPVFWIDRRNGRKGWIDGCGLTPDTRDRSWHWRPRDNQPHPSIIWSRRGPQLWHTSRKGRAFLEWKGWHKTKGWHLGRKWFDCSTAWPGTPAGFRHAFSFLWRSRYDSRPVNPITRNRIDCPRVHEVLFFEGWRLADLLARPNAHVTSEGLQRSIDFDELARNYRIFAVPKSILTIGAANANGEWIANHLKRGSSFLGPRLKKGLIPNKEILGNKGDWDALADKELAAFDQRERCTDSDDAAKYITKLVSLVFPDFDLEALLAPTAHRQHRKKYVRKRGTI